MMYEYTKEYKKDLQIVEMMTKFGGSFVQQLAQCWIIADGENKAKIKATWPNYWSEYEKFLK